jgi:hypothetical protein
MTAGGIRIAAIAARRITESKERIGKDVPAIQRASIIEVSTRIIGWPIRTAISPL